MFALPHLPLYCFAVSRSRAVRYVSVALVLLAASAEPVWEIAHAIGHAAASHHADELAGLSPLARNTEPGVSTLPEDDGHDHPVFQAPVRPAADLTLAVALLPFSTLWLPLDELAIRRPALSSVSARASPQASGTIRPRAPPLA